MVAYTVTTVSVLYRYGTGLYGHSLWTLFLFSDHFAWVLNQSLLSLYCSVLCNLPIQIGLHGPCSAFRINEEHRQEERRQIMTKTNPQFIMKI